MSSENDCRKMESVVSLYSDLPHLANARGGAQRERRKVQRLKMWEAHSVFYVIIDRRPRSVDQRQSIGRHTATKYQIMVPNLLKKLDSVAQLRCPAIAI
jgi:hypothetical protein